jgi:hypothetical protein
MRTIFIRWFRPPSPTEPEHIRLQWAVRASIGGTVLGVIALLEVWARGIVPLSILLAALAFAALGSVCLMIYGRVINRKFQSPDYKRNPPGQDRHFEEH